MAPQYVELDVRHRNGVEGDGAAVAAAAELERSSVLVSVVHGGLDVVTRAAVVVEGAVMVAVLIVLSIDLG